MSPVKASTGPPGANGQGWRPPGAKWPLSTPFGITTVFGVAAGPAPGTSAPRPARRTGSDRTGPRRPDRTRAAARFPAARATTRASASRKPAAAISRSRRRRNRPRAPPPVAPPRGTAPCPRNRRTRSRSAGAAGDPRSNRQARGRGSAATVIAWLRTSAPAARSRRRAPRQGGEVALVAHPTQRVDVAPVVDVVDEAAEMDCVGAGEVRQEMIGPDLVALVGREGNSMREEQDLRQSPHPGHGRSAGRAHWRRTAAGGANRRSRERTSG